MYEYTGLLEKLTLDTTLYASLLECYEKFGLPTFFELAGELRVKCVHPASTIIMIYEVPFSIQ